MDESRESLERLTTAQAALRLGITEAGIRKRVQRGQIPYERDETGRLWVWISPDETGPALSRDALVEELHNRVRYLERQVEEERESRRRADTVIAQLSAANAEQARTIRAIEAPSREEEPPAPPETPPDTREYGMPPAPQPGRTGPQAPLEDDQYPSDAAQTTTTFGSRRALAWFLVVAGLAFLGGIVGALITLVM